jgi:hypothetical protein
LLLLYKNILCIVRIATIIIVSSRTIYMFSVDREESILFTNIMVLVYAYLCLCLSWMFYISVACSLLSFPFWLGLCLLQRDCMLYNVHCHFDDCSYYMPNKWQSAAMGPKSHASSRLAPACIQHRYGSSSDSGLVECTILDQSSFIVGSYKPMIVSK